VKRVAFALGLVVLAASPSAAALVTVTVGTQTQESTTYGEPFGDTYGFSLAPTAFNASVHQGTVSMAPDFGTVRFRTSVQWATEWIVSDGNGVSVNVEVRGEGSKTTLGTSRRAWDVYVNNTHAWIMPSDLVGVFGWPFKYRDAHVLQYLENASVIVPADKDGNPVYDWPSNPAPCIRRASLAEPGACSRAFSCLTARLFTFPHEVKASRSVCET
jgi:hypothetical protein